MHTSFITALKSPVVHSKRGRRQTRACARACVLVQKIVLKMKKKKTTNVQFALTFSPCPEGAAEVRAGL